MFGPTRYLTWARRFYGKVRCDLATSGMPAVPVAELGLPKTEVLDDPGAWPRLESAIARHNAVPDEEATATLGTTHALWLAYASLTSHGDEILVETPGYEPLTRIAEGVGLTVRTFERYPADRFALDPGRVARAMTSRTRVIVVTNLHNPTGVRAPDDVLRAVAEVAASHGAFLLVDEVYAAFDALADATGVFRGSARRLAPNVVAVSSLTKCYGLGALRIGWLLAPPEVTARARDAITASCGMLPLPHAHLALHAFERLAELSPRTRPLAARRARVGAWVKAMGLTWSEPAEGLFGFVDVPGAAAITEAVERSAQDGGVLVAPGPFFGAAGGFRIAWAKPVEVLDEGLALLQPIVRSIAP